MRFNQNSIEAIPSNTGGKNIESRRTRRQRLAILAREKQAILKQIEFVFAYRDNQIAFIEKVSRQWAPAARRS